MLDAIFGVEKLYKNGLKSKIKNPVSSRVFNFGTKKLLRLFGRIYF